MKTLELSALLDDDGETRLVVRPGGNVLDFSYRQHGRRVQHLVFGRAAAATACISTKPSVESISVTSLQNGGSSSSSKRAAPAHTLFFTGARVVVHDVNNEGGSC